MNRLIFYPAILLFAMVAATGKAQLGDGWTKKTYPEMLDAQVNDEHKFSRQIPRQYRSPDGSCSYANVDGVEEFHLWSTNSNRIEVRVLNDYQPSSVGRQFEGDVMLLPPTGNESLVQIFGNDAHATLFMLHGSTQDGGSLKHYDREVLATNIYNTWVHVNVIHMPGESVRVYIDGVFKGRWPDGSGHAHYFKYGCYGTLGTESAGSKWKNVKFFFGGTPPAVEAAKTED